MNKCRRCGGLMIEFHEYCKHFNLLTQFKCTSCGDIVDDQILTNRVESLKGKGAKGFNKAGLGPNVPVYSTGRGNSRKGGAE